MKENIRQKEKLKAIWDAKWALLNPIIILGGIYAGIFTPTEAAAVESSICIYLRSLLFTESLISKKCLQQLEMHVIQQEQPW